MSPKRNGTVRDLTVEILKDIRTEMRGLRGELTELRGEVTHLREDTNRRFEAMQETMAEGFAKVNARFDHVLEFAGNYYRDHEERIRRLEAELPRR